MDRHRLARIAGPDTDPQPPPPRDCVRRVHDAFQPPSPPPRTEPGSTTQATPTRRDTVPVSPPTSRPARWADPRIWPGRMTLDDLFGTHRPDRFGYRHQWATRRRCQASNVAGVTSRRIRSCRSSQANAARTARSRHEGRDRPPWRRSTATSCRNTSSSAATADSLRARTTSHRNRQTMIR
jgi:hypothetical protein